VWEQPITDEAEIRSDSVLAYRVGWPWIFEGTMHPLPVEPPDFKKAAAADPALREELHRLLQTYKQDGLVALANALRDSVIAASGGARPSGPHRYPVPLKAAGVARAWAIRIGQAAAREPSGRRARKVRDMMTAAIAEVAPLLPPSTGTDTRRARAEELLDSHLARPPQTQISAELARALLRARPRQGGE